MHPTLNIALRAARAAADKLSYVSTNFPALLAEGNSKEKIIAQAMDDAQYRVEKTISRAYDDAKIVFVHLNQQQDAKQSYWHINLLSGSKNFLSGFPYFCVIVSQYVNGRIENTAIVNPLDETEFIPIGNEPVVPTEEDEHSEMVYVYALVKKERNQPEYNHMNHHKTI